jgi:hypothetical protein
MAKPIRTSLLASLASLVAAGQVLEAPFLGLYTNNVPIVPDMLIGDLVEPTFTGYARAPLVGLWEVPFLGANTRPTLRAAERVFRPADAVGGPQTIRGWFIADLAAAGLIRWIEALGTPVELNDALASLAIIPLIQLDPASGYGDGVEAA